MPRLEALVVEAEATSGVETTQRCACYPIRPTRSRADLGLNRKKQINPGDSKGNSLWWVFGAFLPNQKGTLRSKPKPED